MKRRPRAFMIITVLLLLVILLVLCGAYLQSQMTYYRSARINNWKASARQLALSGLEDVRLKVLKDFNFPPTNLSTNRITYIERVEDEAGVIIGTFRITLRSDHSDNPCLLLYVQSEGRLGPPDKPVAAHTLTALLDLSPTIRGGSGSNPQWLRWTQVREADWQY